MKRVISTIIAASLAAAVMPLAAADGERFNDVPQSHWAYQYIEDMAGMGVLEGYDNGSFMPDSPVTRAEFAKMLVGAGGISKPSDIRFADVDDGAWYSEYVAIAAPYLTGAVDMFNPESGVRRMDVAAAIARVFGGDTSVAEINALTARFPDLAGLSDEEKGYIALVVESGIMDGFDEGVFLPEDILTRAQAAAVLSRAFDTTVVLTVGDEVVYNRDLVKLTIDTMGYEDPEFKLELVNDFATIFGAAQLAKARGLALTAEDIELVEEVVDEVEEYDLLSSPDFIRRVYTALAYESKLFEAYSGEIDPSDEVVEKYFNENYYRAKHILVDDEALANELLKRVLAGEDFDKLMIENTTDPGSETYTDGYVFKHGDMVQEFEDCVKSTKEGGFGMCKSDYGYHIISRLPLTWNAAGYDYLKDEVINSIVSEAVLPMLAAEMEANGLVPEIDTEAIEAVG